MEFLHEYGYGFVFTMIFLEQVGLPIPAAPVLIVAGALCAGGMLCLPLVLFLAILGCLLGDIIWYEIGRCKGRSALQALCRLSLSQDVCVKKRKTASCAMA